MSWKWHVSFARTALAAGLVAAGLCASMPSSQGIGLLDLTAEQVQADYAANRYTAVELTQSILDQINL